MTRTAQAAWKPSADEWSVVENVEHLFLAEVTGQVSPGPDPTGDVADVGPWAISSSGSSTDWGDRHTVHLITSSRVLDHSCSN